IQGVGRQMINTSPSPFTTSTTSIVQQNKSSFSSTSPAAAPTPETPPSSQPPSSSPSLTSPPAQRENGIPIVFMYGDRDWMDQSAGHAAKAKIEEEKARVLSNATEEENAADKGSA